MSDQGPEFGSEFTATCKANGIDHSTSTSRNPQENFLSERIHQTIGQVLHTMVVANDPKSIVEGNQVVEETLVTAMHACSFVP
jgi:transposase InsO family protein